MSGPRDRYDAPPPTAGDTYARGLRRRRMQLELQRQCGCDVINQLWPYVDSAQRPPAGSFVAHVLDLTAEDAHAHHAPTRATP